MSGELIIRIHVVLLIWNAIVIYRAVEIHGRWEWRFVWPLLVVQSIFFLIFGTGFSYVCK